ncbi:hypothetical protein PR003_g6155 [Phytophthora rubi]|uniref:Uncharacterized protein n=1 Tax=Phytophthora rubi TaxID=129364 RepID=A0A6A3NIL5_9STRA|nr:hypothetical protein PR001_g5822 [Phytophthora rubi]KAE9348947.1 hypothetical protein PR003_g6155 [Phytophthora rubi]
MKDVVSSLKWLEKLSLASVLKSGKILLQLVTERGFLAAPSKAKKAVRRAVFDFVTGKELVAHLEKAAKLLKPLVKFQSRFEKSRAVASEVFEMFLVLPDQIAKAILSAGEQEAVRAKIAFRFDFVYGDGHGIAYLLDPRFAGGGMDAITLLEWSSSPRRGT